jgi:hypothetical protein
MIWLVRPGAGRAVRARGSPIRSGAEIAAQVTEFGARPHGDDAHNTSRA